MPVAVDALGLLTPLTAAVVLALLWVGEAVWPLFERGGGNGGVRPRLRHLSLGAINAAAAAVFAGLALLVTQWAASESFGLLRVLRDDIGGGGALMTILLFLLALLLLDLWQYVFHISAHKVPILWRLHVVHHNDPSVEATSAMRFHTVEIAIQAALSLPVYALLGVSIVEILLYQLILLPIAMFHHANIYIPERIDRMLRWFIVTPRMHIVHHSQWTPETDSNFSAVLSIWDRLFGTYRWRADPRSIEVGLTGYAEHETSTLRGMLLTPARAAKAGYGPQPRPRDVPRPLRRRDRLRRRARQRRGAAGRHQAGGGSGRQ